MIITDLLKRECIDIDMMPLSKHEVIEKMIAMIVSTGSISDARAFSEAVFEREALITTGIGDGVAIPHGKSSAVKKTVLAAAVCREGLNYESIDGEPTYLIFMIASPDNEDDSHLSLLSRLSAMLIDEDFRKKLIKSETVEEFLQSINTCEQKKFPEQSEAKPELKDKDAASRNDRYELLAVTACPTGIAHTYMAAEKLASEARKRGINIKIETNGSSGIADVLTEEEIRSARAVILAADTKIDTDRFEGKKVVRASSAEGIYSPGKLIDMALENGKESPGTEKAASKIYRNLMNGISHMLPFVIGGGILTALSFLLGDYSLSLGGAVSGGEVSVFLKNAGDIAFSFMLPVLSGYIASGIGDRPALAAGFTGGMIASQGGSGFIGAVAAGFLAGYTVVFLKKLFSAMPEPLEGMKPVLFYPLFSILIVSAAMLFVVNPPLSLLNSELNRGLMSMQAKSRILLGVTVAAMMAVDLGGPFNKAAYVFALAALESGNYEIMAAVMAGGMVPPLAVALAVTFYGRGFTDEEKKAGLTNYIMGLSFITEGAIPFAAADPFRIIPSCVIGSALAGGLSMAFGCTLSAPHGGIFVLPLMGERMGYIAAVAAGSAAAALLIVLLKKAGHAHNDAQ